MKKNLWFKLGLFCTALVLVATCFVTGAWAKYTKTVTASDSARVAKFSVDFKEGSSSITSGGTINLFETSLENIKQENGKNTVSNEKIIAPGSSSSYTLTIENNSEVTISLTNSSVTDTNTGNIPLVFKKSSSDTTSYSTVKELVESQINGQTLAAGASLQINIYWEWKYDNNSDASDTALGEAGSAKYEVSLSFTATQVQPQ